MAFFVKSAKSGCASAGGKVMTVLLLVTALVYGSWYFLLRDPQIRTVGADFAFVNGLYTGSKVTILGVPVGRVEELTPKGDHVHVRMTLPRDIELPADVGAYVLNPSVISDRHLELAPVYTAGPKFPQDGTIPRERTKAPISFDQLMGSLGTLTKIRAKRRPGRHGRGDAPEPDRAGVAGQGDRFQPGAYRVVGGQRVFGARADDIGGLITSLNQLMTTFPGQAGVAGRPHPVDGRSVGTVAGGQPGCRHADQGLAHRVRPDQRIRDGARQRRRDGRGPTSTSWARSSSPIAPGSPSSWIWRR